MRRFDPAAADAARVHGGDIFGASAVMGAMHDFSAMGHAGPGPTFAVCREHNARCAEWAHATELRNWRDASLPLRVVHPRAPDLDDPSSPSRDAKAAGCCSCLPSRAGHHPELGRHGPLPDQHGLFSRRLRQGCQGARGRRRARQCSTDGWWLTAEEHPRKEQRMKARLIGEMLGGLVTGSGAPAELPFRGHAAERGRPSRVAQRQRMNQLLHLVSSSAFIYCYGIVIFSDLTVAMCLGPGFALPPAVRARRARAGHCHDKEEAHAR